MAAETPVSDELKQKVAALELENERLRRQVKVKDSVLQHCRHNDGIRAAARLHPRQQN